MLVLSLPIAADAQGILEGISGYFDSSFIASWSRSTDSSGNTVNTDSIGYRSRFNLTIDTQIFPNIRLSAGGMVERTTSEITTNHLHTKSTGTVFRPYINLTWVSEPFTVGAGYSRKQDIQESGSGQSFTSIFEDYNAIFGWKPEGLPSIDISYMRKNAYDKDREVQDMTSDTILMGVKYTYKTLDVRYQASYDDQQNKLIGLETKGLIQSGRISYSDFFLDRRLAFNTSYNFSRQDVTTISKGKGAVSFQVFPNAGLSVINIAATPIALLPNPALIDGDINASTGINIGVPPIGGSPTDLRQVGVDFLVSSEINQLLLWVDRDLSTAPNISNFFISNPDGLRVYHSSDNLNWAPVPVSSISFGPIDRRFDINFLSPVTARYFKVVTRPLPIAVAAVDPGFTNPDLIFITEIQTFSKRLVADLKGKTSTMSHLFTADGKARILDIPLLFYDFNFFFSRNDPNGISQYTVSNGLSVSHQFSRVFSGTARFAVDANIQQPGLTTMDYLYNASLSANPLKTLTHTLVFSGRVARVEEKSSNTNSLTLNNSAELYKGINVYLTGGVNTAKNGTGEKLLGTTVSFGTDIVPHPTLTLNLNFNNTTSDLSGGDKPDTSSYTRSTDLSISFNPVRTLYLFGSVRMASQKDQETTYLQNYALGWSPFPGGDLQLSLRYSENLRSSDKGRERTVGPSLRWEITRRAALDISYQMVTTKSTSQKSNTNAFVTRFQMNF